MKPDCIFLTSSITQVSHTTRPITPETAAMRPAARSSSSSRLISFTGHSDHLLTMGGGDVQCDAAFGWGQRSGSLGMPCGTLGLGSIALALGNAVGLLLSHMSHGFGSRRFCVCFWRIGHEGNGVGVAGSAGPVGRHRGCTPKSLLKKPTISAKMGQLPI